MDTIKRYLAANGRKGGSVKSERKIAAVNRNLEIGRARLAEIRRLRKVNAESPALTNDAPMEAK